MCSSLFYRGIRARHRLNDVLNQQFIVNVDRGAQRFFLGFPSVERFEKWYVQVPEEEKTMNEVVLSDSRKLFIDIDGKEGLEMFDFERHVKSRIREVFALLDIGEPHVITYIMTDDNGEACGDMSYHVVVANFRFSAQTCMGLCMIIASGQAWEACADTGVYKRIQCVRIEGSTKHGEKRWKSATSNASFRSGLVGNTENTDNSDLECIVTSRGMRTLWESCDNVDMSQFSAVASPCGKFMKLKRLHPGYCFQCQRTHDRENAAVRYVGGRPTFACWRYLVWQ